MKCKMKAENFVGFLELETRRIRSEKLCRVSCNPLTMRINLKALRTEYASYIYNGNKYKRLKL